jgi:uncharacterized membrane protein YfcA
MSAGGSAAMTALSVLAGLLAGVLSAWGVGGGSLLILYMTLVAGLGQQSAQGVNLLYFLPTSLSALISHLKNRLVEVRLALPAIAAGAVSALGVSFLATGLDTRILRKIFGGFILLVGVSEVFYRPKKEKRD